MGPLVLYFYVLPRWRARGCNKILLEMEEERAKLRGSEAPDLGSSVQKSPKDLIGAEIGPRNHPQRNLVKGRRTVEDERRWWCEFLSKKHGECGKLHGSDDPLCDVLKNGLLENCATSDGKPKQDFVKGRSVVEGERHR